MLALSVLGSLSDMVIKVTVRSIDMWILKNPQYPNVHEFLILQQYYVCLLNANFWSRFHPGGSFKDTCVTIKDICIFYNAGQIYKMPKVSLIWERFFEWRKKKWWKDQKAEKPKNEQQDISICTITTYTGSKQEEMSAAPGVSCCLYSFIPGNKKTINLDYFCKYSTIKHTLNKHLPCDTLVTKWLRYAHCLWHSLEWN